MGKHSSPSSPFAGHPNSLTIHTFGTFEILRNGERLRFAGKVPQKPLAMLKAIIACGKNGATKERIMEALWPDSDGDVALISFDTTLHRLRRLLGDNRIINLQECRLRLNPVYCWVDTCSFENILSGIDDQLANSGFRDQFLKNIFKVYRGHFLPEEHGHWVLAIRDAYRSKFIAGIVKIGRFLESCGEWEKSMECFQRGLEIDPLSEEFYQHLMICHQKLGEENRAAEVFNLCRKNLWTLLGQHPSSRTKSIFDLTQQNRRI